MEKDGLLIKNEDQVKKVEIEQRKSVYSLIGEIFPNNEKSDKI